MDIKKILGSNIKIYRKKAELTQSQLSEKIGVYPKHMSKIEVGEKYVSPEILEKICIELNVTPSALYYSPELDQIDETAQGKIDDLIKEKMQELRSLVREEL